MGYPGNGRCPDPIMFTPVDADLDVEDVDFDDLCKHVDEAVPT
jgi:hypothetical protein